MRYYVSPEVREHAIKTRQAACTAYDDRRAKMLYIALVLLAASAVLGYYIFSPFNLIGLLN